MRFKLTAVLIVVVGILAGIWTSNLGNGPDYNICPQVDAETGMMSPFPAVDTIPGPQCH
jgi:hypothetical protein